MYKRRDWVFLRKGGGNAGESSDSSASSSSSESEDSREEGSLDTEEGSSENASEPSSSSSGEEEQEDEGLTAEDEALLMRRLEDISESDVDEHAVSSDGLDSGEEEEEAMLVEQIGYVLQMYLRGFARSFLYLCV